MWLAAENGMFLRRTTGEWMTTATEHLEIGCSDSVKVRVHGEVCSVVAISCLLF
jgi:trehalose-6-phosphatase